MASCSQCLKSPVWDHFQKIDPKKVKCKSCEAYHGGTTSIKSHLLSHHPQLCPADSNTSQSNSMDQFVAPKKCSTARSKEITRRIAEMVARDLRAISLVDCVGFNNLMSYVEPGYSVPSHTHIATVCRRLYESEKDRLINIISKCDHVGLTTDIWTSTAIHGYMTVTVHLVNDSWQLSSKVLVTEEMPECHTGEDIADRLTKVAADWSLSSEKITACVRDNAANAINGVELTGWSHFGCAAHTLQLCIKSGLDIQAISQMIATSRRIIAHFKNSVVAMMGLRDKQVQLEVPQHHLV